MNKLFSCFCIAPFLVFSISPAGATQVATQIGKITMAEGHFVAGCRMVKHKETATGIVKSFRIQDIAGGHDDISSIVLAALVANRDVIVYYDPAVFTGCGAEPQVQVIDMY